MAIESLARCWGADLPPPQMLVLLALADCSRADGTRAHPGIKRIMWMTGLSDRTVRRCLDSLQASGRIALEKPHNRRMGYAASWRIAFDRLPTKAKPVPDSVTATVPVTLTANPSQYRSGTTPVPVSQSTSTGQADRSPVQVPVQEPKSAQVRERKPERGDFKRRLADLTAAKRMPE